MSVGLGRAVSPDATRNLWTVLKNIADSGQEGTMANIRDRIGHLYGWDLDEIESKVLGAAEAQLVALTKGGAGELYALPNYRPEPVSLSRS